MSGYEAVSKALDEGAQPSLLCATCPWDRNCLTPPSMTRAEVDAEMVAAAKLDEKAARAAAAAGKASPLPERVIMTAVAVGDRDTLAGVCPVLALRLRTSAGRRVAETVKAEMQGWDDET